MTDLWLMHCIWYRIVIDQIRYPSQRLREENYSLIYASIWYDDSIIKLFRIEIRSIKVRRQYNLGLIRHSPSFLITLSLSLSTRWDSDVTLICVNRSCQLQTIPYVYVCGDMIEKLQYLDGSDSVSSDAWKPIRKDILC